MSEGQNGHRPINAAEFLQQRVTSLQAENADLIRDLEIAESDLDMAHARMRDFRRLTRLQNERQDDGPFATPKFSLRGLDLSKLRPVSLAWRPWMVMGAYNEILGEEGIGKGTLTAYIVAGITTGTLTGDLEGQPRDVLYIGADEDDWEEAVGPRLHRAGANLSRVVELHSDHGESFNLVDHADDLDRVLQHKGREFGLVVVEQVLDVLPYLRNPNDPMAIRHATKPLRAILRDRRVTGLAARHVNKAEATSYRQAGQGSVQFGAVARSGFLVADHPTDEDRRVVVMGKANYAAKTSMSFELGVEEFVLDGRVFKVTCARDFQPEQIDMAEALKGRRGERGPSVKDQVKQAIRDALADGSATKSQVAKTIERELDNSTLKKAWTELAEAGELKQDDENKWWWSSPIEATTTTTNTDDEDDR